MGGLAHRPPLANRAACRPDSPAVWPHAHRRSGRTPTVLRSGRDSGESFPPVRRGLTCCQEPGGAREELSGGGGLVTTPRPARCRCRSCRRHHDSGLPQGVGVRRVARNTSGRWLTHIAAVALSRCRRGSPVCSAIESSGDSEMPRLNREGCMFINIRQTHENI